jgi:hypothetical protein
VLFGLLGEMLSHHFSTQENYSIYKKSGFDEE